LSEKPAKLSVMAAIIGFIGVGLLVLGPSARLDYMGLMAALAGAATMGLGTVLAKRWQPPVPLIIFTAWQLTLGGLMLLPIALVVEGSFTEFSRINLWGLIYLGLIGTGLSYALWFRGICRLKPTAVSALGLMNPVVATLIGYVFLQQTLTPLQLLGVVIVLGSVLLGQLPQISLSHLETSK
jgi:probable blue pigment (indigoidine) exporter